MQQIALNFKESDIRDLTLNSQGIIQGQKLQDFVSRNIGNKPIEQFPGVFCGCRYPFRHR